ncbi:MAG: amidohydrolase [Bacilli bacterium]|nr:amidohydrolase [Bacilli bacterium]
MKILFKNALILTMKNDRVIRGEVLVSGEEIAQVAKKINVRADKVIDCEGNLLMPGLKSAHSHSAMVYLRSLSDDLSLQKWLNQIVFPSETHFQTDDVYHLTKLGLLEYLTSGVTAAAEHYYFPPEIVRACEDIGMRARVYCLPNCARNNFAVSRDLVLSTRGKDCLVKYGLGTHAQYTSSEEELKILSKLVHEIKEPIYIHAAETLKESDDCQKEHNLSVICYLAKLGLFDYGGGIYHGVYLTKEDVEVLKAKHVSVCSCPCSNLKLASGIAPIKHLYKAGINVAIGTDGPASNNALDMFREMYLVSVLSKYREKDPASLNAFAVLKMATVNSAKMLGFNRSLYLAKGQKADMIMIDLSRPDMQPINNIVRNLVYAGNKLDVKMTMINGKILYYNQKFYLKEDVFNIYKRAQAITNRIKRYLR